MWCSRAAVDRGLKAAGSAGRAVEQLLGPSLVPVHDPATNKAEYWERHALDPPPAHPDERIRRIAVEDFFLNWPPFSPAEMEERKTLELEQQLQEASGFLGYEPIPEDEDDNLDDLPMDPSGPVPKKKVTKKKVAKKKTGAEKVVKKKKVPKKKL